MTETNHAFIVQKEEVVNVPRKMLRPRSRCIGMKDFIRERVGYDGTLWQYVRRDIMESLELEPGGHLRRVDIVSSPALTMNAGIAAANEMCVRANMYDLYLCYDGRVRYIPDANIEEDARKELRMMREEDDELWRSTWSDMEADR